MINYMHRGIAENHIKGIFWQLCSGWRSNHIVKRICTLNGAAL